MTTTLGKEKSFTSPLWAQDEDRYHLTSDGKAWLEKAGYQPKGSKRPAERGMSPAAASRPRTAARDSDSESTADESPPAALPLASPAPAPASSSASNAPQASTDPDIISAMAAIQALASKTAEAEAKAKRDAKQEMDEAVAKAKLEAKREADEALAKTKQDAKKEMDEAVAKAKQDAKQEADAKTKAEAEVERLRRENAELRRENAELNNRALMLSSPLGFASMVSPQPPIMPKTIYDENDPTCTALHMKSLVKYLLDDIMMGGPRHEQNQLMHVTRIEYVLNPPMQQTFVWDMQRKQEALRSASNSVRVNPNWNDLDQDKPIVIEHFKKRFITPDLNPFEKAQVMLMYHGCDHDTADSICRNGFEDHATNDGGYFSKAFYTTSHAQLAGYYSTGYKLGKSLPPNPRGEHVMLANWVTPGVTYPITQKTDYPKEDPAYPGIPRANPTYSKFFADCSRDGGNVPRALPRGASSGYVLISEEKGFQAANLTQGRSARTNHPWTYDELATSNPNRLLPFAKVFFKWSGN